MNYILSKVLEIPAISGVTHYFSRSAYNSVKPHIESATKGAASYMLAPAKYAFSGTSEHAVRATAAINNLEANLAKFVGDSGQLGLTAANSLGILPTAMNNYSSASGYLATSSAVKALLPTGTGAYAAIGGVIDGLSWLNYTNPAAMLATTILVTAAMHPGQMKSLVEDLVTCAKDFKEIATEAGNIIAASKDLIYDDTIMPAYEKASAYVGDILSSAEISKISNEIEMKSFSDDSFEVDITGQDSGTSQVECDDVSDVAPAA